VRDVLFPDDLRLERLTKAHRRRAFRSGEAAVDDWLATKALQNQEKHLSTTKVLLDENDHIAGYFTLATGQVDFSDLPPEMAKKLPRRTLPAAVLAWLGIAEDRHGQGLGQRLLSQALRDCHDAGQTFAFVAVILECLNDRVKAFYQQYDFDELVGHPYKLFLSASRLEAMMTA
jgi:GNAT superfamily N-acetyltransferase